MSSSPTQAWLRENTRFYPNARHVYAHTDALLARFPQIRPKTDVYSLSSSLISNLSSPRSSLRRRKDPASALSSWHSPHHLPPGGVQHPGRDLDHPRLSKGAPYPICRSHLRHAHPLQPIHRPQWPLHHRVYSELATQERGARLHPRSIHPALTPTDSRAATSSASWRQCRNTSPENLRSTRNPRIIPAQSRSPLRRYLTVIPQSLHPRCPVHSPSRLSSLDHPKTRLSPRVHRHRIQR